MSATTMPADYEHSNDDPGSQGYLPRAIARELRAIGRVGRLLDAGCGNGALTATLVPLADEVYAFDSSETGAAFAAQRLGADRVRRADAYDDYRELFGMLFDCIVSTEVIEHLYSPRRFTARAFEALQPGGTLIVTTPYNGWLKNVLIAVTGKYDQHHTALWDHGHIKFWSRDTLRQLLEEAGFVDVRFSGAGRAPYLWKSMVAVARKPR